MVTNNYQCTEENAGDVGVISVTKLCKTNQSHVNKRPIRCPQIFGFGMHYPPRGFLLIDHGSFKGTIKGNFGAFARVYQQSCTVYSSTEVIHVAIRMLCGSPAIS